MSHKKKICLILFFLCSFCTLFSEDLSENNIEQIKRRGVLRVALYKDDIYPLFYHNDKGKLTGHEIDLALLIAESLDVSLEFNREASSFDDIVKFVQTGKADLGISLISRTLRRAQWVYFSEPYLQIHPVVLFNRRSFPHYREGEEVQGLLKKQDFIIGVKKGTSYITIAESLFPGKVIRTYSGWDDVFDALKTGEVDVVIRDEIGVKNTLETRTDYLLNVKMFVNTAYIDSISIALPPGDAHFMQWINIFLDQNGYPLTVEQLFKSYETQ